jgi:glyoxylase-like metal-dependent hydrolase (beta-lactamase superfamily II)
MPVIEEVLPNLFRMEIPLPENPLRSINSYAVKGKRSLIVDTGLRREECRQALRAGIESLGIDLTETDFFLTHAHGDHIGLAKELAGEGASIFLGGPDADFLSSTVGWDPLIPVAEAHGFPIEGLRRAITEDPSLAWSREWLPACTPVGEGETLAAGDYRFELVATPGHTPGHVCLYEPDRKLLLSGDHVLGDISPNITCWSSERNPLEEYFASLDKVRGMDVARVLPGHRRVFANHRRRIDQLKAHHQRRLQEVLSIVSSGRQTAYWVASQMTWDLNREWARWPVAQRWFATGEAISHLRFLEGRGHLGRDTAEGRILFFRKSPGH